MRRHSGSEKRREKAKAAWGASLGSVADVVAVFVRYTSGAHPGRVCCNPTLHLWLLSEWDCLQHDMWKVQTWLMAYPNPV